MAHLHRVSVTVLSLIFTASAARAQEANASRDDRITPERLGLPKADTDQILHHNAQKLFGFAH